MYLLSPPQLQLNPKASELGLGVSTVESNRDRDVSTHREVLFQTVEESVLEMSRSRVSIEISTKIEISWHFRVIETVKTWVLKCRDFLDSRDVGFWNVETPRLNPNTPYVCDETCCFVLKLLSHLIISQPWKAYEFWLWVIKEIWDITLGCSLILF